MNRANRGYLFPRAHNGRELATTQDMWWYQGNQTEEQKPYAQTIFFH